MKNVRRHLLINPSFQLSFSLFFMSAMAAFTAIFPLFGYLLFEATERHSFFAQNPPALQALHEARKDVLFMLGVLVVVTLILSFLLALYHSHKIAGPLYKLRMAMISMQQGVLHHHIRFRERDNFPELADGFNAMIDAIFIRRRRDFERVHSVLPKLERLQGTLSGQDQAAVTEILTALKELSRELPMK